MDQVRVMFPGGGELLREHSTQLDAWVDSTVSANLGVPQPGVGSSLWVHGRRVQVVGELVSAQRMPSLENMVLVSREVICRGR